MLNPEIFQKAIKHQKLKPDLDCFARRLKTQLPKYISYKPDHYAYLIDTFQFNWSNPSKDSDGLNRGCSCSSKVANSALVQQFSGHVIPRTTCGDPTQRKSTSTTKTRGIAPLVAEATGVREVF